MKIRKATKKDFKEIAEIIKNEYGKKPYNEKWTIDSAVKTLDYYNEYADITVVLDKDNIIGFLIVYEEYYNGDKNNHVEEIIVISEYQGRGIGRLLMEKLEKKSKKKGIKRITLDSKIKSGAYSFYKKLGFKAGLEIHQQL